VDANGENNAWLELCRRAVAAQREIFADVSGIEERTEYDGVGEGGDHSLVIDRAAEDAIFELLGAHHERTGEAFTAISEERGEISFGEGTTRVVIDPIDGSLNARRTIPSHCLSVGVASGETMADVEFAYIYDFGAGEEFVAARGSGATLDGRPLQVASGKGLEIVGFEGVKPERGIAALERLTGSVYRIRVVGAIAISASYVAAGRFDGMISLTPCRSVDAAATQLIAREAGATVKFGDGELEDASLSLDARYFIATARNPEDLPVLREAQRAVPA
jgi:myo-inositol-1(or 4)-monophosphatase